MNFCFFICIIKNYFVLFYINFNIIISFIFHYVHDCQFEIINNTGFNMYEKIGHDKDYIYTPNIKGNINEFFCIKSVGKHGTYLAGYLDFGKNCKIKIPTNNLITTNYLKKKDTNIKIGNFDCVNLTIDDKDKEHWNISFNNYKFPSSCNSKDFISIKTYDLNISNYDIFNSISIKNLIDNFSDIYMNNK